ncbi:MAG: 16S rRNA (adenine(1518)-N(6)/adenine(1519)-N(6))-dimethyltransferase RsmA [Bacilli bacterium]|nr:16S rRNA (adenine(1518)-N(6)/adenine(1519)-N(6))-dimethyltransferase RsmA [Bacilli bacterium]
MEYSPKKMQENIDKNNFRFKKQFGQNFICDENIINNIIDKAAIDKNTLVIEVGPGAGSLTNKLALNAKNVLCYEIDKDVKEILEDNLKDYDNVKIIYEDFLNCHVKEDLKKYEYDKLYLVANLPYYITTPIIMKLVDDHIGVDKIVVMVQKEVGDRFKAKPKTKDYGSLTVFLNYYFEVRKIMDVSKNVFMPKPNVDSIVVEFIKTNKNYIVKNEDIFFKIVKDSFKQKRKTIKNNLREYDLAKIEKVLLNNNFSLSSRAEEIPIEVFVDIANELSD